MCERKDEERGQEQELEAFEAMFSSLRPRTDRLDGRWRLLLAEEARLAAETSPAASHCSDPTGHRFVCLYCGGAAPMGRARAWPLATAAMTVVAASLLLVLLTHAPGQRVAPSESTAVVPAAPHSPAKMLWAADHGRSSQAIAAADGADYFRLRNQILRDGLDAWKSPSVTVAVAHRPDQRPLIRREQIDQLLSEQDSRGS